jgi:hypothetical protein
MTATITATITVTTMVTIMVVVYVTIMVATRWAGSHNLQPVVSPRSGMNRADGAGFSHHEPKASGIPAHGSTMGAMGGSRVSLIPEFRPRIPLRCIGRGRLDYTKGP